MKTIEPLQYKNLLKIGFFNCEVTYNIENFENVFDALVLNDGDFGFINMLFDLICQRSPERCANIQEVQEFIEKINPTS